MRMLAILAMAWAAFPLPASAQTLSGPATAIDGDSLSVAGTSVRLFGIDAPEAKQSCKRDGNSWPCGEESKIQLQSLVAGNSVHCEGKGTDTFGRTVAVCSAGGLNLNQTMVEYGWAVAFRKYSSDYVPDEIRAKASRVGIWDSEFVAPEEYRHQGASPRPSHRETPAQANRASPKRWEGSWGCAIKGNRSRRGEWIYHLPGMPYYEETRPEELFCTESEAQAAGYRRSRATR